MKIVFFGDSITDASRKPENECAFVTDALGTGYVIQIAGELSGRQPEKYEIVNRGISGNRVVDLYARVKSDVINLKPDVVSILVGVNDVSHEIVHGNGVEITRFETIYGMLIDYIKEELPQAKIILCEPFVEKGISTAHVYDKFLKVREYAKVVAKLAEKYGLYFLPLQDKFDEAIENCPVEKYVYDGVHPNLAGAKLIADEWLELFRKI